MGSRRRILWDVYRTFIGHRGGFVCITDYNGTQARRTFLSTLTVRLTLRPLTEDLISWHGDKLALIGLDDPVITVSFFDEIPLNPDKCCSDNRMYRK